MSLRTSFFSHFVQSQKHTHKPNTHTPSSSLSLSPVTGHGRTGGGGGGYRRIFFNAHHPPPFLVLLQTPLLPLSASSIGAPPPPFGGGAAAITRDEKERDRERLGTSG
ncbi:hypothetical protein Hdeb2414_s0008g00282541 [Helianthus debilis subsp. tardiflorus]